MTGSLEYNEKRIDNLSQVLLQVLRDSGGRANTSELKTEAGVDDPKQVRYRFNNYLIPAGLAEEAGREDVNSSRDAIVYKLTDEGIDWLVANEDEVMDAVGAAKAVESIQRMQDTVANFSSRLGEIEDDVDRMDDLMDNRSSRLTRMKNNINDLEDAMMNLPEPERVGEMEETLSELEKDVDAVQDWIQDADTQLETMEDDVEDARSRLDDLEQRVKESFQNVDRKLSSLYENQQMIVATLDEAGIDVTSLREQFQ